MKRRQLIHNRPDLKDRRRQLRKNQTLAERLLWSCLRNAKLEGKKFRRQHSIGPFIVDFYCPECRVIVELDGAVHKGVIPAERDYNRTQFLARFDAQVLRFENRQVMENRDSVVEVIRAALRATDNRG
jgi:very-short-patch-repair endonuclease